MAIHLIAESRRARIEPMDMIALRKVTRRNVACILWLHQSVIAGASSLRGTKKGNEPTINVAITREIRRIVNLYTFPDLDKRSRKELFERAKLAEFIAMQSGHFGEGGQEDNSKT